MENYVVAVVQVLAVLKGKCLVIIKKVLLP
jgi:hypothetical protein